MRLQPIPHDNIVRILDRWGPAQTLHCVAALREGRQKDVVHRMRVIVERSMPPLSVCTNRALSLRPVVPSAIELSGETAS
eukprot:3748641-Prymnesium_polylepis.1